MSFERGGQRFRGGGRKGRRGGNGDGAGSSRGRPPAHLRGRAIGLYYRDLNREKNKAPKMLVLPDNLKREIWDVLKRYETAENESTSEQRKSQRFLNDYNDIISVSFMEKMNKALEMRKESYRIKDLNEKLYEEHLNKQNDSDYLEMLSFRKKLPMYERKDEILKCIKENQVVVISGETGCGKTTQIGQLILEEACMEKRGGEVRVLITQPRRIAAVSVATRIAEERAERLGDSVGYTIRLGSVVPRNNGSIELVTSGVLVQRLQGDPALLKISHLVLDEVHERDNICDILMGIVKIIITRRKDIKIILMSATIDADRFCQYYGGCPLINVPGVMFPVKEYYLEDALELTGFVNFQETDWRRQSRHRRNNDVRQLEEQAKRQEYSRMIRPYLEHLKESGNYSRDVIDAIRNSACESLNHELVARLVRSLMRAPDGAILIFLPGHSDISKVCCLIEDFPDLPPYRLFPLHSRINTSDQQAIFRRPPNGVRKIVVATNIAETSITIDDVVYVIDCGRMKIEDYVVDKDLSTLTAEWISQANAHQRRGRAGRVKPGECWRLYTKARADEFDQRPSPELLRAPLHEPILSILLHRLGPADEFLSKLLDPPQPNAINSAVNLLCRMRILNDDKQLTPLGVHIAKLPVAPGAARMLILASLMSATAPATAIAATIAFKDPFLLPIGKEKEAEAKRVELSMGSGSDQLAAAEAQRRWMYMTNNEARNFCSYNFLSHRTMEMLNEMRSQFGELLYNAKFLNSRNPDHPESNQFSSNKSLMKALIVAGLYPNVATYRGKFALRTDEDKRVEIHPGSVNKMAKPPAVRLVYRLKQKSSSIFLHDTSPAHAIPLLFFGDHYTIENLPNNPDAVSVGVGGGCWAADHGTADLLVRLRNALDKLLQRKLENPAPVDWDSSEGFLLKAIIRLITAEDDEDYNDDFDDMDL